MPQPPKRIKFFSLFLLFLLIGTPSITHAVVLRDVYELAVDAYNKGQYDQAIKLYEEITSELPQFAPAYIGIGLALKAKGADLDEVVYYYKLAVEKDPTNAQALEQLGRLYYSVGQLERARVTFEKALKINPNLPEVKQIMGWIYLVGKKTNPEKAIVYFKDVLRTNPIPTAYFGLGISYFAVNQREKVMDIIMQLKNMNQNDLAEKLERSLRENRRVILDEFNITPAEDEGGEPAKDDFEKTPDQPKGMKVRLRGKLDQL